MRSAKSIISKRINPLNGVNPTGRALRLTLFTAIFVPVFLLSTRLSAQDNSPYSRFGIGDLVPPSNINMRGMGGISAAYHDPYSINYSNPATFGSFQAFRTPGSTKIASGRAILDVGLSFDNRTLREPNAVTRFTASNATFSHVMLGVPLKQNLGLSFGLRPISRISYKMVDAKRTAIDSSITQYMGDGGTFLASMGIGKKFLFGEQSSFSIGATGGYMFGRTDYSQRLTLQNDSLAYTSGNFEEKTSYGNLYYDAGFQLELRIDSAKQVFLTLGGYGNLRQRLRANRDRIAETYFYDESVGYTRIDSVSQTTGVDGRVEYPSSYTAGFTIEKRYTKEKPNTWMLGLDVTRSQWNNYTSYGVHDPNVQDNWKIKLGGEVRGVPKANYFSNVIYRAGFSYGPDYLKIVGRELKTFGASLGFGLPLRNYSSQSVNQATIINLSLEYSKRGTNDNPLKENLFRVGVGFSLSDIWFVKRKYE